MKLLHSILLRIAIATIACVLVSCASAGPKVVFHSFEFNANWDSPDIEVLDYKYGHSKNPGTHPPDWAVENGKIAQRSATGGYMQVGEFLFVKWKIKGSEQIYQENIDLRNRLPADLYDNTIYFVIRGSQLYVYLITPKKIAPGTPSNGLRMYGNRVVKTLYPD
jgi:hypothetical protein